MWLAEMILTMGSVITVPNMLAICKKKSVRFALLKSQLVSYDMKKQLLVLDKNASQ